MQSKCLMIDAGKKRYPRKDAIDVARELVTLIAPHCEKIIVAGSLRRRKQEVGDVEIIYIPSYAMLPDPDDLFGKPVRTNITDRVVGELAGNGVISRRLNKLDRAAWGEKNKLAVHVASGIPVDLFSATIENWFNYLVCRTGGKETNQSIARGALAQGWHWAPYDEGFWRKPSSKGPEYHDVYEPMRSEAQVFNFAGLDYLEPWERK